MCSKRSLTFTASACPNTASTASLVSIPRARGVGRLFTSWHAIASAMNSLPPNTRCPPRSTSSITSANP
jgi:hypothetical protein